LKEFSPQSLAYFYEISNYTAGKELLLLLVYIFAKISVKTLVKTILTYFSKIT